MQHNQALDLKLRPSRQFAVLMVFAHALAIVSIWHLDFPLWIHISLKFAIALSLGYALLTNGWFGFGGAPAAAHIEPARTPGQPDAIEVQLQNGQTIRGLILDGSFVAPNVTVVRYKPTTSRRFSLGKSLLIFPDSLDAESFRSLRVRLRWGNAAAL